MSGDITSAQICGFLDRYPMSCFKAKSYPQQLLQAHVSTVMLGKATILDLGHMGCICHKNMLTL